MSDDSEEKPLTQVEFHFEIDPAYRIYATNGAMVGPTPRGEIKIDFFVESGTLPIMMVNRVTADLGIGEVIKRDPPERGSAVRRLQAAVLLSAPQARELARAILQKIALVEAAIKEAGEVKDADIS